MKPKKETTNKNARDRRGKVPVDLAGIKPADAKAIDKKRPDGPPDYTMPGYPSGRETAKPDNK